MLGATENINQRKLFSAIDRNYPKIVKKMFYAYKLIVESIDSVHCIDVSIVLGVGGRCASYFVQVNLYKL